MSEQFTYQISDLDQVVTDAGYAYADFGDVEELAEQLQELATLCFRPVRLLAHVALPPQTRRYAIMVKAVVSMPRNTRPIRPTSR